MEKIQITVRLTEPQHTWLKEAADNLGITVADFIRRVVDRFREQKSDAR